MTGPVPSALAATTPADSLGALVKQWRTRRGRSQLDLSLAMGVSQRHLSFIENGRSTPSRALVLGLARALDVPFRDRNALLLAAGYAPLYAEEAWDAAGMRMVHRALDRLLKQHAPWPALVLDRHWNVLMVNEAAPRFFGRFVDLARFQRPRNLLRLMFAPDALRPAVHDWPAVARTLLDRVAREAPAGIVDEPTRALLAELTAAAGLDLDRDVPDAPSSAPVIPVGFIDGEHVRRYFSMVSTVGTPRSIAAQELRVESMFPADDATEAWHLATFGSGD